MAKHMIPRKHFDPLWVEISTTLSVDKKNRSRESMDRDDARQKTRRTIRNRGENKGKEQKFQRKKSKKTIEINLEIKIKSSLLCLVFN
jgi:hypothetical protein